MGYKQDLLRRNRTSRLEKFNPEMQKDTDANRYVQLTETGLNRVQAARRRYRTTIEDIVGDPETPSVNTVKRVMRRGPVFVSTLERIWEYFRRCAQERRERLPYLAEGEDYVYVEVAQKADGDRDGNTTASERVVLKRGWISRQVPRPNRLFTGRREVLDHLHSTLKTGPVALVADPQALTGLGGIGKTQTAIAYIYEHWNDYCGVFWVSAETVEDLNDGLAGMAEELNLLTAAPATKRQALEMMHDWFRTQSDWLLVLDNADDIETLAPYFPRHHSGRLIITTRARNTVKWAAPISLAKFGREEGALLLLRRAGMLAVNQSLGDALPDDVEPAMALSDELDGLALALDQAGAYLAETTGTVADYHARYREYGLRLLDSVTDEEHASVTVTYTLALDQMAKRSAYGQSAVEMVRLCAFLAPDAIPEVIFTSYAFGQTSANSPAAPCHYDDICAAVCGYSLASRNPINKTVTVHRLVQKVTRESMDADQQRTWAERSVQAVADATPDFEFEDWSLCDQLLPQWRTCAEFIRDSNIDSAQAGYLLYQAGRYLRARALYSEAEATLRPALAIAEKVHGNVHQITADYMDELACLYRVLDRRPDAEPLHVRAVAIMAEVLGPDHPQVASKLHNLALLYVHYEDYVQAEPVFLRALAIYEKQPNPDYQLIATTLTQLAGVYRNEGSFDKAEPHCRRALEIYESMLEPGHIDIATGTNNLALLYLTMGRYSEAEELYLRALNINEQARGEEHPETATVVWGLARVRWKQGRVEDADELFRRAVRIYTKHFGADHSRAARIASSYAEFKQATSRLVQQTG